VSSVDASHLAVEFLFLDTEFTSLAHPELISLGIAGQCAEFYVERTDFPKDKCSPFVHAQVLPKLGYTWEAQATAAELPARLADWLADLSGTVLVVAYDYADDWKLLERYLPVNWHEALLPIDVRTNMSEEMLAQYFDRPGALRHHALHDARALRHSCGLWVEQMQLRLDVLLPHLTSLPAESRASFLRTRWPELGGSQPLQALNEGMLAAVCDLVHQCSRP
jgi:hypothetical protein